jgi:hypothetical protein
VSTKPLWRQREDALVIGAPLLVIPALAYVPITISLLLNPAFRHARFLGVLVIPVFFLSEFTGLFRLALALRRDFDVLTLFAVGTVIVFWVITVCSGVLLAIVIGQS